MPSWRCDPLQAALAARDGAGNLTGEICFRTAEAVGIRRRDVDGDVRWRAATVHRHAKPAVGTTRQWNDGLRSSFAGETDAASREREVRRRADHAAGREWLDRAHCGGKVRAVAS